MDPDPALFVRDVQDTKEMSYVFLLITFWRYIYITAFFKDKKSRSHKTVKNQGFSYFFCFMMKGSGSVQIMTDPVPWGPKHADPTDPNPQHCKKFNKISGRKRQLCVAGIAACGSGPRGVPEVAKSWGPGHEPRGPGCESLCEQEPLQPRVTARRWVRVRERSVCFRSSVLVATLKIRNTISSSDDLLLFPP